MRHSRYKYFSNVDHAKQFLDGRIFHQTLSFYRDDEDAAAKQVIGDQLQSTRIYRPASQSITTTWASSPSSFASFTRNRCLSDKLDFRRAL
jgi:hypothetical protein